MVEKQKKGHAIMICVPAQGHLNPFVNLALKLGSRGITVTFVNLHYIHHKISKAHGSRTTEEELDLFSEARQSGVDIRYTTISDGFPLEFDRDVHFEQHVEALLNDFPARVADFVGKMIESDPNYVYFLVTDTIYHWAPAIAHSFNLLSVSFWTEHAFIFSLYYHWDLLIHNHHFPCSDDVEDDINYIPGVDSINTKDLPSIFKETESSAALVKMLINGFKEVKKADFILHNTVHELEPQTLSALNNYQPNYAIGPCINFNKNQSSISRSLWSEADCTSWLESKPPASVLYVSFGSTVHINKKIMEEIAYGLLLSEVHFIWVVRQGILGALDYSQVLPDGFQDEIEDQGLIVPWCNQTMVLSNPAVGGFLTHNGWNSTVESMWYGVPMICYPIAYDQFTNRKLVVDHWKIGVKLCDGKSVDRNEVAEKVMSVMNGAYSRSLRQQALKLRGVLHDALETEQGSSERNFDQFMKDLEAKIHCN